jgi:hypothetical protein
MGNIQFQESESDWMDTDWIILDNGMLFEVANNLTNRTDANEFIEPGDIMEAG